MRLVILTLGFLAISTPDTAWAVTPTHQDTEKPKAAAQIPDEPQAMLREARRRYSTNDVEGAIVLLERLVDVVDPTSTTGRLKLGRAYVAVKKYAEAKEMFELVVAEEPGNVGAWCDFAELYCRSNQPDIALRMLEPVLKNSPDSVDAITVKGHALMLKTDFEESEQLLRRAVDMDPDRYSAFFWLGGIAAQKGRFQVAVRNFRQCLLAMNRLGLDPLYGVPACESLGDIYYNLGQYKNAIHWLEQVKGMSSNSFVLNYKLGVAHGMMMHYDDARKYLGIALEFNPRDYQTRLRLAHILETQNELEEALKNFYRAKEANPTDPHIHDRIGNVLSKLSRFDEAKESLKTSIDLGSFTSSPFHLLAKILKNEKNYEEAIQFLDKGLAMDPLHVESYYELSQTLPRTGKPEDRERAKKVAEIFKTLQPHKGNIAKYQSMIEISPRQVDARAELAEILFSIDKVTEAQLLLDQALEIRPDHFKSRMIRGLMFQKHEMGDKGRNDLLMAQQIAKMALTQFEKVEAPDDNLKLRIKNLKDDAAQIDEALKN